MATRKKATSRRRTKVVRKNPLLGEAYQAGRTYAAARNRRATPRYSGFDDWYKHAGSKVRDIAGFDKQDAKDLWTSGVNSIEKHANAGKKRPAKKVAKKRAAVKKTAKRKNKGLLGKAKAEFLKRMAAGRKKAAKVGKKLVKKASKSIKRNPAAKRAKKVVKSSKVSTKRRKAPKRRLRNGEESAAAFYEKTHGRAAERDTFVTEKLQEHTTLAGMGRLEELAIRTASGDTVDLTGFKGAILAMNEKGTQLFIKGGDQTVDLGDFDIEATHEMQVLGHLVSVVYHTRKDHLTAETGGKGSYEHFFEKPRPTVIYDTRNKLLTIAGGAYVLKDVGVVR